MSGICSAHRGHDPRCSICAKTTYQQAFREGREDVILRMKDGQVISEFVTDVANQELRNFTHAILHGDEQHRNWLLDSVEEFIRTGTVKEKP